jgi:hypothetical protein
VPLFAGEQDSDVHVRDGVHFLQHARQRHAPPDVPGCIELLAGTGRGVRLDLLIAEHQLLQDRGHVLAERPDELHVLFGEHLRSSRPTPQVKDTTRSLETDGRAQDGVDARALDTGTIAEARIEQGRGRDDGARRSHRFCDDSA